MPNCRAAQVVDVDVGCTVPTVRNLRALPTPGAAIWPQALFDLDYEGARPAPPCRAAPPLLLWARAAWSLWPGFWARRALGVLTDRQGVQEPTLQAAAWCTLDSIARVAREHATPVWQGQPWRHAHAGVTRPLPPRLGALAQVWPVAQAGVLPSIGFELQTLPAAQAGAPAWAARRAARHHDGRQGGPAQRLDLGLGLQTLPVAKAAARAGDITVVLEVKVDLRDGAAWGTLDRVITRFEGAAADALAASPGSSDAESEADSPGAPCDACPGAAAAVRSVLLWACDLAGLHRLARCTGSESSSDLVAVACMGGLLPACKQPPTPYPAQRLPGAAVPRRGALTASVGARTALGFERRCSIPCARRRARGQRRAAGPRGAGLAAQALCARHPAARRGCRGPHLAVRPRARPGLTGAPASAIAVVEEEDI